MSSDSKTKQITCPCGNTIEITSREKREEPVQCPSCKKTLEVSPKGSETESAPATSEGKESPPSTPAPSLRPNDPTLPGLFEPDLTETIHFRIEEDIAGLQQVLPEWGPLCACCNRPAQGESKTKVVQNKYDRARAEVPVCKNCQSHFLTRWQNYYLYFNLFLLLVLAIFLQQRSWLVVKVLALLLAPGALWFLVMTNRNETLEKNGHHLTFHLSVDSVSLKVKSNNGRLIRDLKGKHEDQLMDSVFKEKIKAWFPWIAIAVLLVLLTILYLT